MAKKLNLKGTNIDLKVTKIGGVTEEVISSKYQLTLIDEEGRPLTVTVLGLEKISTHIQTVKIEEVVAQFKNILPDDVKRPTHGEVDCLMGMDVAAFHPIRIDAVSHLLLLRNQFGLVVGGSHPKIQENTVKVVQHAHVNLSMTSFVDLEKIGIECKPRCGSCRCGKCHPGGLNMTLQEEEEYKLIEGGLEFDSGRSRWLARYPCKRDLSELPDNRSAVLGALKSLERRLKANPSLAKLY